MEYWDIIKRSSEIRDKVEEGDNRDYLMSLLSVVYIDTEIVNNFRMLNNAKKEYEKMLHNSNIFEQRLIDMAKDRYEMVLDLVNRKMVCWMEDMQKYKVIKIKRYKYDGGTVVGKMSDKIAEEYNMTTYQKIKKN